MLKANGPLAREVNHHPANGDDQRHHQRERQDQSKQKRPGSHGAAAIVNRRPDKCKARPTEDGRAAHVPPPCRGTSGFPIMPAASMASIPIGATPRVARLELKTRDAWRLG